MFWKTKKTDKVLHMSGTGYACFLISLAVAVDSIIVGAFIIKPKSDSFILLLLCIAFNQVFLALTLHDCCFIIYIKNNCFIIKKTLFSEIKIDLRVPGVFIDDQDIYKYLYGWKVVTIFSPNGETIQFYRPKIKGDLIGFIENCKSIQKEYKDFYDNHN